MNDDIIFGKNAITEALIKGDREINKILISKNIHTDAKIEKIKSLAREKGIVFQFVAKEKFQPYAEFNHQGIIAQISFLRKNMKMLRLLFWTALKIRTTSVQ